MPVPSALELANECLADISEGDFKIGCHDLITGTDYFEKYETDKMEFIDESNYAIGLIGRYLRRITGRTQITAKLFREKFQEITKQIGKDMYQSDPTGAESAKNVRRQKGAAPKMLVPISKPKPVGSTSNDTVMPWTEIELTTCGQTGPKGPSLEECISTYKTEWCKKPELFNVEPNRPGIQIIRIPKTGVYEITAWGAGNYQNTGSGPGFTNVLEFLKF